MPGPGRPRLSPGGGVGLQGERHGEEPGQPGHQPARGRREPESGTWDPLTSPGVTLFIIATEDTPKGAPVTWEPQFHQRQREEGSGQWPQAPWQSMPRPTRKGRQKPWLTSPSPRLGESPSLDSPSGFDLGCPCLPALLWLLYPGRISPRVAATQQDRRRERVSTGQTGAVLFSNLTGQVLGTRQPAPGSGLPCGA